MFCADARADLGPSLDQRPGSLVNCTISSLCDTRTTMQNLKTRGRGFLVGPSLVEKLAWAKCANDEQQDRL